MRLFLKVIVVTAIVAFVAIQFFQPEKNINKDSQNLILNQPDIPENIQQIIINACVDCHSNNTRYPWYDRIAPVSWMVSKHIKKGKKELNFSKWGEMDKYDKITALEDIRQELEQKTMPLKSYTLMHKKARLSDDDRAAMLTWIDKTGNDLVKKSISK
jgi:uncharacterized membrane protein